MIPAKHVLTNHYCQRKLTYDKDAKDLRTDIFTEALYYTNRFEEGIIKAIKEPQTFIRTYDAYASSHKRALQEAILNHKDALTAQNMSIIDMFNNLWKDMRLPTEMKAQNTQDYIIKHGVYGNDLWWNLTPKMTFNLKVEAPILGISIIIDRVDNYDKHATPLFVKRSNGPEQGIWHSDKLRLGMAIMALAENKATIHEGIMIYAGEERTLTLTPELVLEVKEAIRKAASTLARRDLPERTDNKNKCESCPYKEQCYSIP